MSEDNKTFIQGLLIAIAPTILAGFAAWESNAAKDITEIVKQRQNIIQERLDENDLLIKAKALTVPVGYDLHWFSYLECRNQNIHNSRLECSNKVRGIVISGV